METITVGIADCQVSNDPNHLLVTHGLGSCIAVTVYDPVAKVAGMLHFMLADSRASGDQAKHRPHMFADTGIPDLFHAAYARGADKRRMIVRLVGGAQVLDPNGVFNIGKKNHAACRRILWAAGVLVHAEEVGGKISRTVRLEVASGKLLWNSGGGLSYELAARGGF
ncbi:MAG TPA: chemotaxis protein CheD [Bryobacteraceae bacterium]